MEVRDTGGVEQRADLAPHLRLATVLVPRSLVHLYKAVDPGIAGPVRHRAPINISHRDEATRPHDAKHLAKRSPALAKVLEHLVGVGYVKRGVGERKVVHARLLVAEVFEPSSGGLAAGRVERFAGEVQADHLAGGEPFS